MKNNSIYYSPNELRSKGRFYNFVVGERGNGKTYSMKKLCINNFLKKKENFVWVRRYKTELEKRKIENWFQDVAWEYPELTVKIDRKTIYINDEVAGFFVPLSTSQRDKSDSSFHNVSTIVYDEFLITADGGNLHYIKDEPILFLEFTETVFRMRDTGRESVFFIGNAFSVVNPYFVYLNIKPNIANRFTLYKDIAVEITHCNEYREQKKKTRFGRLISGTKYGSYAIDNQFFNDDDKFLRPREDNLLYMMTLKYRDETIGIWVKKGQEYWYCDKVVEKQCNVICSMTTDDMIEGAQFKRSETMTLYLRQIKASFYQGKMFYSDNHIKKLMYEFIHMY